MSKPESRHPHATMLAYARALAAKLAPVCRRVEIAGSLRRGNPAIKDIELCVIPPMTTDLFGVETPNVDALWQHMRDWPIHIVKSGDRYRQFTFPDKLGARYTVDLFLATPETWGYIYMLRTGSWEFSRRMVTARSMGGLKPEHIRCAEGRVFVGPESAQVAIDLPEEADLFRLWEMEYVEPEARGV